jgi:AcrR family transcriptional regulator
MARTADAPESTSRRDATARATRESLINAALELFTERGYADIGTEQVVARAAVTRGALYHHFADKRDLFRAAHERVEEDLVKRIGERMEGVSDPWEVMVAGTRAFLEACDEQAVKQIALTDAPAVLGWGEWREIDERYGLGLMKAALGGAMDAGVLRRQPLDPLAHLMLGAMTEAAFMIANAEDPDAARTEAEAALFSLLDGLRA